MIPEERHMYIDGKPAVWDERIRARWMEEVPGIPEGCELLGLPGSSRWSGVYARYHYSTEFDNFCYVVSTREGRDVVVTPRRAAHACTVTGCAKPGAVRINLAWWCEDHQWRDQRPA